MRKKDKARRVHIEGLEPGYLIPPDNLNQINRLVQLRKNISDELPNNIEPCSFLQIIFTANPSYYRIYSTVKQVLLSEHFSNQYNKNNSISNCQNNLVNSFGNIVDYFIDDDQCKYGQLYTKNIPKVISMGLNVVLDIIKDTYQYNQKICVRSLESLYNLLQALKPESLKNEPAYMIEKYFELIQSLIEVSYSSVDNSYENYNLQILELSLLSLLSFSLARGDAGKILNCIKLLLVDCNVENNEYFKYQEQSKAFQIEIPEIIILFNKHVCSYLIERNSIPEWCDIGFPMRSLCETFQIQYDQRTLNTQSNKFQCNTSLTFDGQYLILYRCNRIFLIGSGYNETYPGQEINSSTLTNFNQEELHKCCSGGWIGYINGEIFLQPYSNWSSNKIYNIDSKSLKVKSIIPLISDYSIDGREENPFSKPTLCTTDGDCLILITVIHDDYITIRELKPMKLNLKLNCDVKEKISFSLNSEFTIRLSSVRFSVCGKSLHNLIIPSQNPFKSNGQSETALKLIDINNFSEPTALTSIMTGKDFALLLTETGKVFYTGNSHSLGIRHTNSYDKFLMLDIPKPVKIIQIAIGHEGNHALLLADDGTLFFVGTAKRGEDGDTSSRSNRFNKPIRLRKFTKIDSLFLNISQISCNHATSAIITKSGELYLFGKDSHHTNSNGLIVGLPKDFQVKSIALGKAHMLILSTKGLVVTSGFSNKGQCGFNHNNFQHFNSSPHHYQNSINEVKMNETICLDSRSEYNGHTFVFGKSRRCVRCLNCTENGSKCPPMNIEETYCICGNGNSGCINCGICSTCSETYSICINNKNSDIATKSLMNIKFGQMDFESDYDCSSKISSIPPTVLPLSQLNPIKDICTGLHHSVLLTEKGEVFTFGSNQFGQLGVGDFQNRFVPTRVKVERIANGHITQISAGSNHTVLLTSLGEVLTFGNNQNGQLGRSNYKMCNLNKYLWNTIPDRMDEIGPEFGRIAIKIQATGDFTFVKYDEILLSSNMFLQTKLIADKNNLMLIPPSQTSINIMLNVKNMDNDQLKNANEKKCRHLFCIEKSSTNNDNSIIKCSKSFNNLNSNILIISRTNGNCNILKQSKTFIDIDSKRINFDQYSSLFVDKFYQNLWAYNSFSDDISRFNLISIKMSTKINQIVQNRKNSSLPLPTSMFGNFSKFHFESTSNKDIKYLPSIVQPNMAIPISDNCLMKKTLEQLSLELLSLLSSFTYSYLLGLTFNEKLEQMNLIAKNILPEEYLTVCRFEQLGGGWGYPAQGIDAIRFSTDCDIILGGIGLYGGRGKNTVQIRLYDIGFDGGDIERDGELLKETDIMHYECLHCEKYQLFFEEPLFIEANRWYVVWTSISGPSSDCGTYGQSFLCTSDQVMFHFKASKLCTNGTDVNGGQIPTLLYKQIRPNEFKYYINNNNSKVNSLSVDEEGIVFSISKEFVLNINSQCFYSLCEILRFVWNLLKNNLLNPNRLEELFQNDEDGLKDELDDLLLKIRKNLYIACFSFELIRSYVEIIFPSITFDEQKSLNIKNKESKKFLRYDYDEYKQIANALYNICSLLTTILVNPIQIQNYLEEKLSTINSGKQQSLHQPSQLFYIRKMIRSRIIYLNKFQNFFLDECYRTYQSCCNAFYPTNSLKWSILCDLLSSINLETELKQSSSVEEMNNVLFTNKQLYLLSALVERFCEQSIRLTSFFPVFSGSIEDSFINFDNQNNFLESDRESNDLIYQIISKHISEFYPYNDHYLYNDFNCKFVYERFLNILVRPLRFYIEQFQSHKINTATTTMTTVSPSNLQSNSSTIINCQLMERSAQSSYKKFNNYIDNGLELSSSLSSSNSSSSSSTESTSSSSLSMFEDECHISSDFTINESQNFSSNISTFFNETTLSWDNTSTINELLTDNSSIYQQKLIQVSCDLLLKFISEFNAYSLGLINTKIFHSKQNIFPIQNECCTPSRFCRRSLTKCWETGSGSPEAICFWVNKSGIYISGVKVYSSVLTKFKYQLQLLDQAFDDIKTDKYDFKWKTIASVSGVYFHEDNSKNKSTDVVDIRFERPILIQPNIKYALLFKNHSQYSYSGDMGMAQVRGDDDIVFMFMDCSLSKNGTNLNRGQIPQILYFNIPSTTTTKNNDNQTLSTNSLFDNYLSKKSIITMFKMAIDIFKNILQSLIESIKEKITEFNNLNSLSSSNSRQESLAESVRDTKILSLIYKIFDSIFIKQYLPMFIMHLKNLKFDQCLSKDLIIAMSDLIPLISTLNQLIHTHFQQYGGCSLKDYKGTSHHIIVESDHPYKFVSVTNYLVRFPKSVKFMTIEFDPKCCTAQPSDYLEIYIPQDNNFNITMNNNSETKHCDLSFHNLAPIYQRFSGKNFEKHLEQNKYLDSEQIKDSLNCIFIPGNEIVFVLKTSDYVHSDDIFSNDIDYYYGFKAEIIGYEFQIKNSSISNCLTNKENVLCYINHMTQLFECDLVNLFSLCINSLLNSSPIEVFQELLNKNSTAEIYQLCEKLKSYAKYFNPDTDLILARQIFQEHSAILQKGYLQEYDLSLISNSKYLNDFFVSTPNKHSFLEDFIDLNAQSSGCRLAHWLQNVNFIMPNACLVNVVTYDSVNCCDQCFQFLLENNFENKQQLCPRCHYQFFVKTLAQPKSSMPNCINTQVGKKIFIKIITRDQHEEIVYDKNAYLKLLLTHLSFSFNDSDILDKISKFSSHIDKSDILETILQNPYQLTIKDDIRYHSITMLKCFENYSFEELRLEMYQLINKKTFNETISVQSFDNGYYLASWIPTNAGCYQVQLLIDGESSSNVYTINVNNDLLDKLSFSKSLANYSDDAKIKNIFNNNQSKCLLSSGKQSAGQSINDFKHSIRKFICSDSAGLRIRALPSLQSEQIGIVAVNGLLTVIDQIENDDGIWVRLSNESIQAYSHSTLLYHQETLNSKELSHFENFESNIINDLTNNEMNPKQLRTEAWALQYNKHFSRTLLVSIDSDHEINGDQMNQDDQTIFLESLTVPGWFQVIHRSNGGHLIRNWPSLEETSFIIGITSTNEIIYAVEIVQNEFGVWIRLSHESLHSHINTLYKSTLLDNNIEGWMLIRSINGNIYLRNIQNNYLNSTLIFNKELESNYTNNNKYDEFSCFAVTKNAISNRAAKCIRAVFAAFVWHDGILNDVLTAASYLKFNAEITKDLIKFNSPSTMNINKHFNDKKKKSLENRRNQKVVFRHSVEVSQLMTIFQYSDVNSNVNFLEDNNNNENFNDQQEEEIENSDELSANMIPEILINLLQIWDFVSTGCLKLFDDHICLIKNNITDRYCEINSSNENTLFQKIIQNIAANKKNEIMREHVKITNTEEFYDSILSSVNYLLSLVPSNEMVELSNNSNELSDRFSVKDNQYFSFQLLQHFDIKKSFYEEKLVEEKMTDLALSLQKTEDYQHLLSPDFYDNWRTVIERESDEDSVKNNCVTLLSDNCVEQNEKQKQIEKHKFHRSISVGMNEKLDSLLRPVSLNNLFKYLPLLSKNRKYDSKNNLNANFDSQDNVDSKFNIPFLCKPSIRLVNLVQKYQLNTGDKGNNELLSSLKLNDVFKFIFSCYNVDLYDLMTKSAICSAAYRTFALNVLNWLLLSVSNPLSVHEILWIFVYSLLPSQTLLNDKISNVGEDENSENQMNKALAHEQLNKDVCRHPFYDLTIAGEMAERLITNSLHRFMKSISNLLSLLPMGSALQKMAIRCFAIEFNSCDHIFLHECKVFSHISAILTRSSLDDCNFLYSNTVDFNDCQISISKDITNQFEFKTSSRESMISSLMDNSTETFWESGQEDRTRTKNIIISKSFNAQQAFNDVEIKYFCIYVDNTKDNEYKISRISLKICSDNKDTLDKNSDFNNKYLTSNNTIKVKTVDVNGKFFGWIQIEFNSEHNNELINNDKYLQVELNGPFEYLRVRQIKLLSCEKNKPEQNKPFNALNYHQIQTSSCETETLRVFRLLTSQVFGKLLSNNLSNMESKRLSIYQNKNEIDLREHMVGILFSQYGKLTELQKQALLHIVKEIHLESARVLDDWKAMLMFNDDNNNMNNGELTLFNSKLINTESNDSYCFELLSLVLALSGSNVGQEYLSQQKELFYDILTLLHTSSDRVKRQVLSLVRRIIPNIHPLTFAKLFGVQQIPNINDIFEKCSSENPVSMGILDIFLSCIAKSLTIQIKIKGVHVKRSPTVYTIHSALQHQTVSELDRNHYWLNGSISKQISQSIILLIKDMTSGQFGQEWSEVARNSIFENIFKLTQLDESSRSPQKCIQTTILWMAFASLCVLDENDTDMFYSSNYSKYHNTSNSNSSLFYCDNHDDGETIAFIQCNFCGRLCSDCDRFLHLNIKTRNHKRHIFKDELDSIKVDIHEGCGRVKFFWSLIVADSKQLKAMIEFKNNLRLFSLTDESELNSKTLMENVCRFCGVVDSQIGTFNGKNVCQNEDCQLYLEQVCQRTLNCGHICCGILNESSCLPCLNGCSKDLKQDGDDMCMICFSESLFSAPCIQLTCNHVFHYHCVQTVLEKRWSGGRITFTFSQCPICKIPIDHPSLVPLLDPIRHLFEDVQRKALLRLEFEGLNKCDAITCTDSRFYQNPIGFAMERYSYYLCFKCRKAYYGGEARCDAQFDENNFNAKELICGSCSDITKAGICSKHGTDFLEYKCRFCCSVAVYFCFGTTHFCNACHEDFQRLILLKEFPPCPVGPHCIPLDTEECPLHIVHPPTGQEFALGCAICRNTF